MAGKPMDVTRPGKAAPDSTGRPVIVGHKPVLQQDPMVSGEADTTNKTTEEKLTQHGEKVIARPANANDDTDATDSKETKNEPTEAAKEEPVAEADKVADEDKSATEETAIVGAVAEQANGNKKRKDGELSEEEKKKQAELEKLIQEKKYFIPIKVASSKRHARWNAIFLVFLLLFVGAYLAADAGIINIPIKLPIDIIKN